MKTITINVTARRIERAKKFRDQCKSAAGFCPIALAAKAVVPRFRYVSTGQIGYLSKSISLPIEAQQFIEAFDAKGVVRPFKFKVTLP